MAELYWTGGPAQVRLYHAPTTPRVQVVESVRLLEDFRSQCQRLWFAFDGMVNGRPLALERLRELKAGRHNRVSVGTQFPDQDQSIGKSTFAQITVGELFDAMASGGEFEQLNVKALLVFIDALWENSIRKRIADTLQVHKRDVKCELMADLRRFRNLLLYGSQKAKRSYVQRATLLPQIWDVDPDNVVVTGSMLQALVEQLNAIRVNVA